MPRWPSMDLAGPDPPNRLINVATDAFGHLDILVCTLAKRGVR